MQEEMKPIHSKLALAVALWGWLLLVSWLSYDYSEYRDQWVTHIFQERQVYEIHTFHVLIFLVPFIYTFLAYLVNEREKLLQRVKESEESFRSLSLRDELTKLHNRRGFDLLADQQFKTAERTKDKLILLFVDVDNLKWINDNLGHNTGDQALIDTADILRLHIRKADILARFGGDEFAAIINSPSDSLPRVLSLRLEESLTTLNRDTTRGYTLSLSTGFAFYDPDSPRSFEALLAQADNEMYENKRKKEKGMAS